MVQEGSEGVAEKVPHLYKMNKEEDMLKWIIRTTFGILVLLGITLPLITYMDAEEMNVVNNEVHAGKELNHEK